MANEEKGTPSGFSMEAPAVKARGFTLDGAGSDVLTESDLPPPGKMLCTINGCKLVTLHSGAEALVFDLATKGWSDPNGHPAELEHWITVNPSPDAGLASKAVTDAAKGVARLQDLVRGLEIPIEGEISFDELADLLIGKDAYGVLTRRSENGVPVTKCNKLVAK